MTIATGVDAPSIDLAGIQLSIDECLMAFLKKKTQELPAREIAEVTQALQGFFAAGGKRIRPVLCVIGWHCAGVRSESLPAYVIQAAASLEMFHAFALIHDDLMDRSDTRRGRPTVHRSLAARHRTRGRSTAGRFGTDAALLVGDFALVWADELLHSASCPPARLSTLLPVVDTMRTEVMLGQYLDLLATGNPTADVGNPLTIVRYKTAKYTIERPLHVGAIMAEAADAVLEACTAVALPLGDAFQLRDDVLGVFGDPGQTGKPALDDLRDGKHTVLLALALKQATPAQERRLRTLIGRPDLDEADARQIQELLKATGALAGTEELIACRRDQALRALSASPFPPAATAALRQIIDAATARTS